MTKLPLTILLTALVTLACSQPRAQPPSPTATPTATRTATAGVTTPSPSPSVTQHPSQTAPTATAKVALQPFASGFSLPLFVTHAGDGSGDIYVVEKGGLVKAVRHGSSRQDVFLDIRSVVNVRGNEQGLLGLAFHPRFRNNGYLYVNYTDRSGNTIIARYTAAPDRRSADAASAKTVLSYNQPYPNHNGGMLLFGPDGKLWIGTGDGGAGGDPQRNAQNTRVLLGKMLRIDVDAGDPYSIPPDNPYVKDPNARPEIWAVGLRNPWRYSFDRINADLWIADVGQNSWEEIHFIPAQTPGGLNFGWNIMEGTHCYPSNARCDRAGLILPVAEYANRQEGCSITGGYVYRGRAFPALLGKYFFTDYCSNTIWSLSRNPDGAWARNQELRWTRNSGFSSFGEDEAGELYLTGINEGAVYRLTAE